MMNTVPGIGANKVRATRALLRTATTCENASDACPTPSPSVLGTGLQAKQTSVRTLTGNAKNA